MKRLALILFAAIALQGQPAAITIIEFGDYLHASSRLNQPRLAALASRYPGQVKVIFRHVPVTTDTHARAALLAEQNGLFPAVHPQLFSVADPLPLLRQHLPSMDIASAMESKGLSHRLENDIAEAVALGITGPSLLLGGRRYASLPDDASLERILDGVLGRMLSSDSVTIRTAESPTLNAGKSLPEVVIFSDFECPYCSTFAPVAHKLADAGLARIVFKHFPLSFHTRAPAAHRAALFAHSQGQFWAMHDKLFGSRKLDRASLLQYAEELKLDIPGFTAALDAKDNPTLSAEVSEGERIEVQGTPTVFINGRHYLGSPNFESLKAALAQSAAPVAAPILSLYGPPNAPHTLEWFFDAQSSLTQPSAEALQKLIAAKPTGLRLIARHLPLPHHVDAPLAHEALIFAASKEKFWEFLAHLQRRPESAAAADLSAIAMRLGFNMSDFESAILRRSNKAAVERDGALARSLEIRGVPVFLLDGKRHDFLPSKDELSSLLETSTKAALSPAQGSAQP
jgi:protein-disulfide isomerase